MDINLVHRFWGEIELEPIFHDDLPLVTVLLNDKKLFDGRLEKPTVVKFDENLIPGSHNLTVTFSNKQDRDTVLDKGLDKAVVIKSLTLAGVESPRFIWKGTYTPDYPELWYNQQITPPPSVLTNQTYLGWNGTWKLEFTSPIFTWIHRAENLGWIHD